MPYLIFIFGIIIATYAFYRFFIHAKPDEIKTFIGNAFIGVFVLILLYFAMSGRIHISLALLVLSIPFIIAHYKKKKTKLPHEDQEDKGDKT